MILTINGKTYPLHFGLGFLREMNKRHSAELNGVATGYGAMGMFNAGRLMNDPLAFADLIRAATEGLPQKPRDVELENYLAELIANGTYDQTMSEVMAEVKKSPLLMKAMGEELNQVTQPVMQAVETQPAAETAVSPTTMPSQF